MDYDNLKDKFLSNVRMLFGKVYWVQFLLNNMILEFSGGLQAEPNLLGLNLWTLHTERNGGGGTLEMVGLHQHGLPFSG